MTKKLYLLLITIIFFSTNVYAYTYKDYQNRSLCGAFEVSDVTSTGSFNKIGCYSNFSAAKTAVNSGSSDNRVVLTKVSGKTKIVYAKYGIVDFSYNPSQTTNLYEKSDLSGRKYTYINTLDTSMTIDGALADVTYVSSKSIYTAKVKIAGFTGWMNANELEIVPILWVKATSSYTVSSTIKHNYVNRPQFAYTGTAGRVIGPKPTMLAEGKYYSYDGHYFYKTIKTMLADYKANKVTNSVNPTNPYYNYYMYLSNHTKTNYSAINIDDYIRKTYTRDVYGKKAESKTSRLYGTGTFFYNAQQQYGVNALLSYSLSRNETGNGTSSLAIDKNNGFGLNAVDRNPYQAANWYPSMASSIMGYSSEWVTNMYAKATHSLYFGPQFGNKAIGMNVKYASDPYWSEKMASNYYYFDNANGLQDYNYYQLGIIKTPCPAKKTASDSAKTIYSYPEYEDALVIVGEVKDGSTTWYKVVSDASLDSNYNIKSSGTYDWTKFVYVKATNVTKINTAKSGYKAPNSVFNYKDSTYKYKLLEENSTLKPAVALTTKDTYYYYDSTLTQKTGKKLLKSKYVLIYAIAYNSSSIPVAFKVSSDYKYDQKHWIPAGTLNIVNGAYGVEKVSTSSNSYSWVNSTTQDTSSTLISGLYTNTYFPILQNKVVNGVLWYKVPVSLDTNTNSYGWTLAKAPNVQITKYNYTANLNLNTNQPPTIKVNNKVLSQNQPYNPLTGVTATDPEDGNLTSKVTVKEDTTNIKVLGTYKTIYQVTDNGGLTTTKEISVVVEKDHDPEITLLDKQVLLNQSFNPKTIIKIQDKEDGIITNNVEVIENTVNPKTLGTYKVTYKITDSGNNIITKSFDIQVVKNKDGWKTINNKKYYYENDQLVKGFKTISNKLYYFDNNGVLQINKFTTINDNKYYINTDGTLYTGWKTIDKKKYYFDKKDGHAIKGYATIDGKVYYFYFGNSTLRTGFQKANDKIYYSDSNGVVAKGWKTINKKKYYFNTKYPYEATKGYKTIDNKVYYFYYSTGILRTGFQKANDKIYYSDSNGVVAKGWKTINKKKYYFNTKYPYEAYKGYKTIDNKLYYFYYGTGVLRTGWQIVNNNRLYSDSNGVVAKGWKKIGNYTYYFKPTSPYNAYIGKQTIDNKSYNFDKYGRLK